MPEFKVVVNDPEAGEPRPVWVRVVGVESVGDVKLEFTVDHKEKKKIPVAYANPELLKKLNTPYGYVTLRIWKDRAAGEKLNITLKIMPSEDVPPEELYVPKAMLEELLGVEHTIGEVFRSKSFQILVSGRNAEAFLGKKIGEKVPADVVGIQGKDLLITGGSDLTGAPMLPSVHGPVKKYVLLSGPPGFHPRKKGERRRKLVRGNTVTEEIVQINTKLV